MTDDSAIRVQNITIRFGTNVVLDNLSVDIKKGEIFGIVGMSGSGKTTFLNTLIGFLQPESGVVLFRYDSKDKAGEPLTEYKPVLKDWSKAKQMFGFAAQEPSFYMNLTVKENLEYFSAMYSLTKEAADNNIKTMLDLVGLEPSKNLLADQLSGGMQKRLDIACSLIHNPLVLLLDEPTSDLDPILREHMWELIKRINKNGTTIVISSHFLREMETLCTRIGILLQRKMNVVGTPDDIRGMYTKNDEIHIETYPGNYEEIVSQLHKIKGLAIPKVANKGHKLIIYAEDSLQVLHHLLHIIEKEKEHLIDINVNKPSLREVFEMLVKGHQ